MAGALTRLVGRIVAVWQALSLTTLSSQSTGWAGYTVRQKFNTPILVSGTKVRVTFQAGTSGTLSIDACYIQTKGSGSFDYSGAPVQITFDGGSSGFSSLSANSQKLSDEISLSFDGSVPLVLAWHMPSSPASNLAAVDTFSTTNHDRAYKSAVNDTTNQTPTGYTTTSGGILHIAKLEVYH